MEDVCPSDVQGSGVGEDKYNVIDMNKDLIFAWTHQTHAPGYGVKNVLNNPVYPDRNGSRLCVSNSVGCIWVLGDVRAELARAVVDRRTLNETL